MEWIGHKNQDQIWGRQTGLTKSIYVFWVAVLRFASTFLHRTWQTSRGKELVRPGAALVFHTCHEAMSDACMSQTFAKIKHLSRTLLENDFPAFSRACVRICFVPWRRTGRNLIHRQSHKIIRSNLASSTLDLARAQISTMGRSVGHQPSLGQTRRQQARASF